MSYVLEGDQSADELYMLTRMALAMQHRHEGRTLDSCCAGRKSFEENMIGDVVWY